MTRPGTRERRKTKPEYKKRSQKYKKVSIRVIARPLLSIFRGRLYMIGSMAENNHAIYHTKAIKSCPMPKKES